MGKYVIGISGKVTAKPAFFAKSGRPDITGKHSGSMASLRDMQILDALARHSHFARAAKECGISQPAFSARIRNMELELGSPMVKRGNRFMGFTDEGLIAIKWARKLLADADGMRQEIEVLKGTLSGNISLGVVPTALTYAAELPARLRGAYPNLSIRITSTSSTDILRDLENFSLDAGITYLDGELPSYLQVVPLYEEKYVLLVPPDMAPRTSGNVSWKEAARLPLCLLTKDMHNRQILDAIFEKIGTVIKPVIETNSFVVALAQVAGGTAATIAPERLVENFPITSEAIRLKLNEPEESKPIGLLFADRKPAPPAVTALINAIENHSRTNQSR